MYFFARPFLLLSTLLLSLCSAAAALRPEVRSPYTTSTSSACSTTKTSTISVTSTSIVCPKTTITPSAVVSTVVKTTTITVTPGSPSATVTSTSTVSTTSTITAPASTSTTTSTVTTVTTGTTTSAFSTPPGFQPAADTIPGSVSVDPAQKRKKRRDCSQGVDPRAGLPGWHSQSATCTVNIYTTTTRTITLPYKSTITAPAPTSTTTVTKTATVTLNPTTITTTVTSTSTILTTVAASTITVTASTTTTSTVFTTQTSYPACTNDNIIGTVNGVGIDSAAVTGNFVGNAELTKYDCCVSCLTNSACAAYIFSTNVQVLLPPACQLVIPSSCTAFGQHNEEVNLEPQGKGSGPDQGLFVGNGYCGSFNTIFTAGAGGGTVGPGPS